MHHRRPFKQIRSGRGGHSPIIAQTLAAFLGGSFGLLLPSRYGFDNVCDQATDPAGTSCVRLDGSRSERALYNWTIPPWVLPKTTGFEGTTIADLARIGTGTGHAMIHYDTATESPVKSAVFLSNRSWYPLPRRPGSLAPLGCKV